MRMLPEFAVAGAAVIMHEACRWYTFIVHCKQKLAYLTDFIRYRPVYLLLLPVFFVLEGYVRNYQSVTEGEALLLTVQYMVIGVLIATIGWLIFRDRAKAALFAFCILAFQFFFGSIQDVLKNHGGITLRYRYTIPATLLLFVLLIRWLKRRQGTLVVITTYLNLLLVLCIIAVGAPMIGSSASSAKAIDRLPALPALSTCDTCRRPDIFLIVPDQYTGTAALRQLFHFDNTAFEKALADRGFHIVSNSQSNYNLTPFSVASTLNMDYVGLKKGPQNEGAISYCYQLIRNNRVLQYLCNNHYQFYNCSVFSFPGQPAHEYGAFLPYGKEMITAQTFTYRLGKDVTRDILTGKFGRISLQQKFAYRHLHFNDDIISLTKKIAATPANSARFVYTHLMMPHYPYYFDSAGNALPFEKLTGFQKATVADYTGYLQYTNRRLLELVDYILHNASTPPIIILLSDHGFRHPEINTNGAYDFANLNAVYLPDKNYSGFYNQMTNVNFFRVLLNTCFHQQLPLLPDSTINVWD
jgi:hypothetical protein